MESIGGFVFEWCTRQMGPQNGPFLTNNPTQALNTQPSDLGPKYAYILMYLRSLNAHTSASVRNRPHF